MASQIEVGLYGKLPSHGDFLRRRVSDDFVRVWDEWLQECMAASRAALGEGWLNVYLTSPVWRFAAAAGAFGQPGYRSPDRRRITDGHRLQVPFEALYEAGQHLTGAELDEGGDASRDHALHALRPQDGLRHLLGQLPA